MGPEGDSLLGYCQGEFNAVVATGGGGKMALLLLRLSPCFWNAPLWRFEFPVSPRYL